MFFAAEKPNKIEAAMKGNHKMSINIEFGTRDGEMFLQKCAEALGCKHHDSTDISRLNKIIRAKLEKKKTVSIPVAALLYWGKDRLVKLGEQILDDNREYGVLNKYTAESVAFIINRELKKRRNGPIESWLLSGEYKSYFNLKESHYYKRSLMPEYVTSTMYDERRLCKLARFVNSYPDKIGTRYEYTADDIANGINQRLLEIRMNEEDSDYDSEDDSE